MKKISIVLLALLLIGGMAFADITLTGTADFGFEFDTNTGNFGLVDSQDTSDVEFSFTLDSADASAMGDADVYAVIEMSGSIDVNIDGTDLDEDDTVADVITLEGDGGTPEVWSVLSTNLETGDEIVASVAIDTAKIVGPDWSVSILGMPDSMSFAQSFELDADDEAIDTVSGGLIVANGGVEVVYGDYTLGADFYKGTTTDFAVYAAGDVEVADGVTVGLAAGYDNAGGFDASAKLAYDMDGTAVAVAMDSNNNFSAFDISASAAVDAYSLDVYYDGTLDAQVVAALDAATITVTGMDLITTQDLGVEVETTVDAFAITVGGGYNIGATSWDASAEVAYTADEYTVTLGGGYNSANVFDLSAVIENTTLIDGATLSLGYEALDLLAKDATADTANDTGIISAMVTIAL